MKHLYRRATALVVGALLGGAVVVAPGLSGPVSAQVAESCATGVAVVATSPANPVGFMAAEGTTVYGALADTDEFAAIDGTTGAVLDRVPVGDFPDGVGIIDGKAYVANASSDNVSVVDLETFTVVATIAGIGNPLGPAVAGGKVYMSSSTGVQVIDPVTNTVITTIAGVGGYPFEVYGYVWVLSGNNVFIIETTGDTVLGGFDTTGDLGVGLAYEGDRAYITNAISNDVSVIRISQLTEIAKVPVGGNPRDAEIFNGMVLVTASDTGEIQAIDPNTLAVTTLLDLGDEDTVDRMQLVGDRVYVSGYPVSNIVGACATPVTTTTAAAAAAATVTPAFTG